MPVEIDTYDYGFQEWEVEDSVKPGSFKVIESLDPARLFIFCNGQDQKGLLQVRGEASHLEVILFKNEDDQKGSVLNHHHPIEFFGSEMIEVVSNCHRDLFSLTHVKSEGQDETTISPEKVSVKV